MTNLNSGVKSRIDAFVTKLDEAGVSAEDADAVLKNPRLASIMAEALHKALGTARNIGRSLGTLSLIPQTADETVVTLRAEGFRFSDWARDILRRMPPVAAEDVELVEVTVAELGFKSATRFDEICARAKELGLELCPAGVGPALRRNLKAQSMNEWLVVAMEPIAGSDGDLFVWNLGRVSGGRWLHTSYGHAGGRWYPVARLVFGRGK